jgi:hypothetical protein
MGGSFFGNSGKSPTYNPDGTGILLTSANQKWFDYAEFDNGGHGKPAKIAYLTRIERLKERFKQKEAMTADLMSEMFNLLTDLLSHRHFYAEDLGVVDTGNKSGTKATFTNNLSGYPAQLNNQILLGAPYVSGSVCERWFNSCVDYLNPEILEATAVLRYSRVVSGELFNYVTGGNTIPTNIDNTNFGCIMDFNLNFTNSDLGTTKYFFISHDDAAIIMFNGDKVYDGTLGDHHAFFVVVTADLINKPLPCQIYWCQGVGGYSLQLRMSNTLGSTMADYQPIPANYISSLTPITGWGGDTRNTSFYTFTQYIEALFHHNHHYNDAGTVSNQDYGDLKALAASASATDATVYVPISTSVGAYTNQTPMNAQIIPPGSGFVRLVDAEGGTYIDITISPFSVNI